MNSISKDTNGYYIQLQNRSPIYLKDDQGNITPERFPWIDKFISLKQEGEDYQVLYRFTNGKFAKWKIDSSGQKIGFSNLASASIKEIALEFNLDTTQLSVEGFSSKSCVHDISDTETASLKKKPIFLPQRTATIVEKIFEDPKTNTAHRSGSLSQKVLSAIELLIPDQIESSVETGCGRSTILMSNKSQHHTVFCLDDQKEENSSVDFVQTSELFKSSNTEFIFGSTQQTLPNFTFNKPIDLAIIDGPHGYPFPELEYFFIYPHLKENALLIVDDLQIPTIGRMFDILAEDEMFEFVGMVQSTGFLRRTNSRTQNPFGDGWNSQNYNIKRLDTRRSYFAPKSSELAKISLPFQMEFDNVNEYQYAKFCHIGWSYSDDFGIYTLGSKASMIFDIEFNEGDNRDNLILSFEMKGLIAPTQKNQVVELWINSLFLIEWSFDNEEFATKTIEISKNSVLQNSLLEIVFKVKFPFVQESDSRQKNWNKYGMCLKQLQITAL